MQMKSYVQPLAHSSMSVSSDAVNTIFDYDYAAGREKLLNLYQKGKDLQWDSAKRIDWSRDIDLSNPLGVPDNFIPIYGSSTWERLTDKEKAYRLAATVWADYRSKQCEAKGANWVQRMEDLLNDLPRFFSHGAEPTRAGVGRRPPLGRLLSSGAGPAIGARSAINAGCAPSLPSAT